MTGPTPWRQMTAGERLETLFLGLRSLIPHFSVLLGFFIMTVPVFVPLPAIPNLGLLLVHAFALYRPQQLSPASAVIIGLFGDILLGTPVGANGLLLPLLMLAVIWFDSQTLHVHWAFDWLAAVPLVLAYQFLLWRLCLFAGPESPFLPFLTQGLATIAAFPLIAFGFVFVQRRFVDGIKPRTV